MNVSFRKNLNKSFMCIEEEGQTYPEYELRILEGRSIPGLLSMQITSSEGKRKYLYDISGKQQIADCLAGRKMGNRMLLGLLFSLRDLCERLPEYLLREEGICLEPEFIYVNLEDDSLRFTYLPFYNKNLPQSLEAFMEYLLRKIDHQDKEAVELGYQVYQRCAKDNATMESLFLSLLGHAASNGENQMEEKVFDGRKDTWENERKAAEKERIERKIPSMKENEGVGQENGMRDEKRQKKLPRFAALFAAVCKKKNGRTFLHMKRQGENPKMLTGLERYEKRFQRLLRKKKREENSQRSAGLQTEGKGFWRGEKQVSSSSQFSEDAKNIFSARLQEASLAPPKSPDRQSFSAYLQGAYQEEVTNVTYATEILTEENQRPEGRLAYQGKRQCEDIVITGEVFLLGKNREQVDAVIEAEGISRLHAKITKLDGQYFMEDLNSTNGTFLNDIALEYHQPRKLSINDKVRFGAEEYIWC